ncbi:hypothetical protein SDRG_04177 [Saprolegnia diclina VS20]|uniref:Uncharacterized protein n=1 Tax=Saprolegnia diclina (strain VS20) TaxID=1156394 RepID=T0QKF5_SAPDV|nr:hypothetical protein SDRG_04177 [Saprolegnia diclina VS20]EQC38469.1 hypothetical protein SDRG_04177 [Saprolegnia diclina VS20]|eukprot:XP_008608061.1 hypothetical protein SDRG_04177 [Saprolegnia diclina VS20]
MQLTLAVNGLTFTVACGEGHQCIKWLGLVAAQRYALMLPHGRCRTREDAHAKHGFYLPREVKNSEGVILSPWSRISDCCRENEVIAVVLQHEVPVDEIGIPVMTEWAASAFSNTSNQQSEVEPDAGDIDGIAGKGRIPRDAPDAINGYAKAHQATHVRSGQFVSQEEIEAAFYHDLPFLQLDEFVKEAKDRDDVEETLLKYYDAVNMIYKHYSIGFGDDMYSMSLLEFLHFVHESTMLHFQTDHNVIDKIFHTVVTGLGLETPSLPRVGFIQALLRVILAYNKMYGDDTPFVPALEKSLKDHVKPAVLRLTTGPFRDTVHTDSILALFQDARPKVLKVYEKYATATSDKIPGTYLNANDLRSLIQDSGIFCTGDSDEHEALFNTALLQCFTGMKDCNNADTQWFVLVEVLEIVSRLSLGIWQDKDVSEKETIRIGLDAVRALAKSK